jgi:CheY-like chemotaxis protein
MAVVTPYSNLTALVIDDMPTQQTTLRGQLNLLGIGKIEQASNADDAIKRIRATRYSLILCDYNLNNKTDGQQLLEFLRDNNLLPADTLFFMVTAESGYTSVASATEHVPDAYLLKPITASDVEERLKALIERRHAMLPITQKLNKDDLMGAVVECDKMIAAKGRYLMQAMQLKGQSLLKLGRNDEAKAAYRAALDHRHDLVWAQLGLARAHKAAGQFEEAKMMAQDIISTPEGQKNVAAYDVMAEALEAQGDMEGALWVLKDSATVVPSARRFRAVGECAYRNGDLPTAKETLLKATKATRGSAIAQPQDTLVLAQTLVDLGEASDAIKLLAEGSAAYKNNPAYESVANAVRAQAQVKTGDIVTAQATIAKARESMRKGKADFATVALAKAELAAGNDPEGFRLLETAISADHENPVIKQIISKALKDTGHEDKIQAVIDAAAAALERKVLDAKKLFRESQIDEAIAAIELAVRDYPENTGVLLQAAQINCMSLRLKKEHNSAMVERVRLYLTRLDKLMPGSDRVTMMKRYFRETLAALESTALSH